MTAIRNLFLFMALAFFGTAHASGDHDHMININTATAKQIAKALKAVGKKKAKAIVAYREANGPFMNEKDLLKVKGIGKKVLAKNEGRISFGMNPCSMKNPCAMKDMEHNPCAMKHKEHNPCAMKSDMKSEW